MATNAIQIPNQTPPANIVFINQRVINTGPLYMRRGTTCCGGYHVSTCSFFSILFFGVVISIMSLTYIMIFGYLSLLSLLGGLFLIGLYIHLRRKAKREFNALPPNHPDRLKYSGFDITQLPVNLNPPNNHAAAPPNHEPQAPPQSEGAPPAPSQGYVPAQGHSAPYPPPPKYDDDPPPYSAICNSYDVVETRPSKQ